MVRLEDGEMEGKVKTLNEIWIDTMTGTYGMRGDLVFLTLTDDELERLDEMGDSDRMEYASHQDAMELVAEAQKENPRG